ncbi:MAG: tRNA (adenosine(37)-N6)-dimethylallyltransferase MiaA [Bacteroidales bacterium]|nr:tRNA (adenosine(37)-N6)-dimethylallyltransferase MiaA [Bacteroidales bacterium]
MKNTLIVILGPTGVGKTDIAIDIALHFNSEIISADSRQFYKEMVIGTAPPSPEQLSSVKHHFVGFLPVEEYYSASIFERAVLDLLQTLFSKNDIVVMVGGSTLYVDAVCNGIDDIPDVQPEIREKYQQMFKDEGIEGLRLALKITDPSHYEKVDLKNPRRLMRALEICESTGRPYSSFLTGKKRERDFDIIKIGITRQRENLYNRINARVDKMVEAGLEEEARRLYPKRDLTALNTVGYKEFFEYFDGKISRETAIDLIKRDSRRYAKRQMTWWGNRDDIHWFNADDNNMEIISFVENLIND